MKPLVSSEPGPPIYLTKRISADARRAYSIDLNKARVSFEKLLPDVPEKRRMRTILRCIDNVQKDIKA